MEEEQTSVLDRATEWGGANQLVLITNNVGCLVGLACLANVFLGFIMWLLLTLVEQGKP